MENEILYFSLESKSDNQSDENASETSNKNKEELIKLLRKLFTRETLLAKRFNCIILKKVI